MERKIGEIFEYNGEWYQCLEEKTCTCFGCDFRDHNCDDISLKEVKGSCQSERRKDNKSVVFKKLEKVGGAYAHNSVIVQNYRIRATPVIMSNEPYMYFNAIDNTIAIEIKQNKEEDMKTVKVSKDDLNFLVNKIRYGILPKHTDCDEIIAEITDLFSVEDANLSNSENIGKNLKPFDLEAAKSGKPVCTRDGRKARIICFDRTGKFPIVALVEAKDRDDIYSYLNCGKDIESAEQEYDLMMLREKKEGWVNVYHGLNGISERVCGDIVSNTKEEAIQYAQNEDSYITTVKIEWEE